MKNKIIIVIVIIISLLLLIGGIGVFYKNFSSDSTCSYTLENKDYNKELKSICEQDNVKYTVYTNKEDLGKLELTEYKVAKHFNFKYFDDINDADVSTKKNIILGYLNFDKDTCYTKSIIEDAISDIFSQKNDINNIFDSKEIKENFVCVNNINTNEVVINTPYFVLNNKNLVQIFKFDEGFYAKNITEYSSNDAPSTATALNLNNTNMESLIRKDSYYNSLDSYKVVLSGNMEFKFKQLPIKLELEDGKVYMSDDKTSKTLLAENIDKVFLNEFEDSEDYFMCLLDKDGNIYEESEDSKFKYQKINSEYKFKNVYDINGYLPVAQTTDDELYNLIEKKLYDVYEEEVYVESNYNEAKYVLKINLNDNSILAGDKDTNYKLKYSFGDYLLTTDNYLFKISDEKLISNNKVKSISVDDLNVDDVLNMHILYVTYENGEKTKLFDVY